MEMPDFGEMVLVKVRIPDTEEVRHVMCGCQGKIYICSGIRFDADGDFGIIWEVFPFPVIEVTDADIISWKKMPKDI